MREINYEPAIPDNREYFEPSKKDIKKAEKTGVEQLTLREQFKDQVDLILNSHGAEGELTPEIAALLIESNGKSELNLDHLTELNPDTAKVLAQFPGTLNFSSLKSLDEDVAKAFFPHTGKIILNSVTDFTPAVARVLASRGAPLEASLVLQEAVAKAREPQSF